MSNNTRGGILQEQKPNPEDNWVAIISCQNEETSEKQKKVKL